MSFCLSHNNTPDYRRGRNVGRAQVNQRMHLADATHAKPAPATAALAYAGVGAAGLATSRLRLRRR